jgi:hypothetical protein
MKTRNMFQHLSARCWQCGIVAIAVLFCGSAFAGSTKKAPAMSVKAGPKATRTICYVQLSNSSFAQPCERVAHRIPRTATPIDIIGEIPMVRVVQK